MNQTEDDHLIYDADDEAIAAWLQQNESTINSFSLTKQLKQELI
jgi:UDP-N-acetylmuramoylalanine--D-glutamate ligase